MNHFTHRLRRSKRFLRVAGGLVGALVLVSAGLFGSSILAGGALANHGGFPSLSIDDNPDPITLGDQLTYDVHFTGPADTVEIYDTLPAEAEFVSSDCSLPQAGIVQCTEFAVASGEVRTNRFVVRPTSAGTITNNARAEEAGVTVDSDSEATLVLGQPGSESVQGPAGPTGLAGSEGKDGVPGPERPAGQTGATGRPGEAGAAGPEGPVGRDGSAGPIGPQGAVGPQGSAGGLSGYEVVVAGQGLPANGHAALLVTCPTGKRVVGGGVFAPGSYVQINRPSKSPLDPDPTNWKFWHGGAFNPQSFGTSMDVYAICANV